jgi:hypothetical protein
MSRLAIYIIGIAALLLVFLGRAADFIRFYAKPAPAVAAKVVWVARGVMPSRPRGIIINMLDVSSGHDAEDARSKRNYKRNDKRLLEDAITQAEVICEETDDDENKVLQDSGVIYLSWFKFLLSTGDVYVVATAMIALICNLFFGTEVKVWGLPKTVELALGTFIPTIKRARIRRDNGAKGAEYGVLGGRPKKGQNNTSQNPQGFTIKTPTETGSYTDKDSVSDSDSAPDNMTEMAADTIPVSVRLWKTAGGIKQKIYYAVLSVFFFQNICQPERETEKFLRYYCTNALSMKGKKDSEVVLAWVQDASHWKVLDDQPTRFDRPDLDMWARLYALAPEHIRPVMLGSSIQFNLVDDTTAQIVCPKEVADWIEDNEERTLAILRPWAGNRHLRYKHLKDPK